MQTTRTLAQPDGAPGPRSAEHGGTRDGLRGAVPESVKVAVAVCATWALLIVGTTAYQTDFISHQTVLSVTFTMAVVGVLAVAEGLVVISGGMIDLSLPTSLILAAAVATTLLDRGWNIVLVIFVAMAIGGAWGSVERDDHRVRQDQPDHRHARHQPRRRGIAEHPHQRLLHNPA